MRLTYTQHTARTVTRIFVARKPPYHKLLLTLLLSLSTKCQPAPDLAAPGARLSQGAVHMSARARNSVALGMCHSPFDVLT